jgi:glucose-6-phosphate 1-dehydrogenase
MATNNNKRPPNTIIFIFGGSGDLNNRKLTPALFNLYLDGLMPGNFAIAGMGRSPYTDEKYNDHQLQGIK